MTFFHYSIELSKRRNSKIVHCNMHPRIKVRGKVVEWPWKIRCGCCGKNLRLRYDADFNGRIVYFNWRKLTSFYSILAVIAIKGKISNKIT